MRFYEKEVGEPIPDRQISLVEVLELIDQFINSGSHLTETWAGGNDPKLAWRWYCKTTGQRELKAAILHEYYYKLKQQKAKNDSRGK